MVTTERRIRHYLLNSKALPYRSASKPNKAMLTGKELGDALRIAIERKSSLMEGRGEGRLLKKDIAAHFGVKPPSLQDWINFGRIGKQHLNELVAYFSDVVGPEHWGIERPGFTAARWKSEGGVFTTANASSEVKESSVLHLSEQLAEQIVAATRTGLLDERGILLLEQNLRRYVAAAQSPREHDSAGKLSAERRGEVKHERPSGRRARTG